jgi:hypothetical protein
MVVLSSLAVATTGIVVSGGVMALPSGSLALTHSSVTDSNTAATASINLPNREEVVSRSDARAAADPVKAAVLTQNDGPAMTRTEDISDEDPRVIARALLTEFGFDQSEFDCLDPLYAAESGWRWNADNPNSSAYGIPQALPGSKMSSAGADWATNPVTQIRWGLGYIQDRYGTPCAAWSFKRSRGWY